MHDKLEDLRLLHVAHQLEETFEGLEKAFESRVKDAKLRQVLEPLFRGGPGHAKLEQALAALDKEVQAAGPRLTDRDLLLAILACEKMAKDFYLRRLDDLSNGDLVNLFRQLAIEEDHHIQAVEKALAMKP